VRVRLERVAGAGCRYFHVDYVALRLLTTYAGAGTEWAPSSRVDRRALGRARPGASTAAVNRAIVKHAGDVRVVPTGWVAVTKGEGFPGNAGHGLVHRSPPIRGEEEARLCLAIDVA